MKVQIVFDSVYGNTEKIARAIGNAITGEVRVLSAGDAKPRDLETLDLLVVGSPTQGGRPTKPIQDFIKEAPALDGIRVAAFDTRLSAKWVGIFGFAAGKIASGLEKKGGELAATPEGFFVNGREGPLKDGELERAASWAKEIVSNT